MDKMTMIKAHKMNHLQPSWRTKMETSTPGQQMPTQLYL